ncbi:hypothetical protein P879_04637 [Paragonimus westermani]|uniref:Vacuolar protein-sorting-associated protein 36 n=1 Tax=Paragonimus westermani TaxID=34504 RepID=A0A8T0D1I5_9TREM|nr:hypothetical protein P879_04637 [Paragonimus westermani]
MDRLRWCSADIEHRGFGGCSGADEEALVLQQYGVRLYDGPERTAFEDGVIKLTTHRLLWIPRHSSADSCIALPLAAIINVRFEEGGGIVRSRTPKVVLRLLTVPALKNALASLPHQSPWMDCWLTNGGSSNAVVGHSNENHIKLGFARTGEKEFLRALEESLKAKVWAASLSIPGNRSSSRSFGGVGIGAIQRQQAARAGATDAKLEEAFDDLKKLMSHAGEMVMLSRTLARRTREVKGGELTTDETAELRSAMLSAGVVDESDSSHWLDRHSSGSFHVQLARQLCTILLPVLTEKADTKTIGHQLGAGCIDLASAYCRINRARGMQLISPDDLLQACELLERERLPLRLKRFPSGLLVLHLASENESNTLQITAELVTKRGSLTADELARTAKLLPLLARERLLAAEDAGLVCRDDSEAGLRFYPNLFVTQSPSSA